MIKRVWLIVMALQLVMVMLPHFVLAQPQVVQAQIQLADGEEDPENPAPNDQSSQGAVQPEQQAQSSQASQSDQSTAPSDQTSQSSQADPQSSQSAQPKPEEQPTFCSIGNRRVDCNGDEWNRRSSGSTSSDTQQQPKQSGGVSFNPLDWIKPENVMNAFGNLVGQVVHKPSDQVFREEFMGFRCNIWTYTAPECTVGWDLVDTFQKAAMAAPFFFILYTVFFKHIWEDTKKTRSSYERMKIAEEVLIAVIAGILALVSWELLAPMAIWLVNTGNAQVPEVKIDALWPKDSPPFVGLDAGPKYFVWILNIAFVWGFFIVCLLRWAAIIFFFALMGPIFMLLAHRFLRARLEMILLAMVGIIFCQPAYKFLLALMIGVKDTFPAAEPILGGLFIIVGLFVVINLIRNAPNLVQAWHSGRYNAGRFGNWAEFASETTLNPAYRAQRRAAEVARTRRAIAADLTIEEDPLIEALGSLRGR